MLFHALITDIADEVINASLQLAQVWIYDIKK